MNLIIDIGNSAAKAALVHDGSIVASHCFTDNIAQNIQKLGETATIESAIISSTRQRDANIERAVARIAKTTTIFDHTTPLPIVNLYQTPETLGMDRLAAAVGAWSLSGGSELLIFDLGTAITIDKVSAAGEYLGGNISPGMGIRFASLNNFTEKLPLVRYEESRRDDTTIGTTTVDAIWKGVVLGIDYEIRSYIELNPTAKIYFTGRDAKNFATSLKNTIFVDHELVIKGLDRILEHNAKKIES